MNTSSYSPIASGTYNRWRVEFVLKNKNYQNINTTEYPGVGFYTSKILHKTAMFEMSAFQCSTSPGLNPVLENRPTSSKSALVINVKKQLGYLNVSLFLDCILCAVIYDFLFITVSNIHSPVKWLPYLEITWSLLLPVKWGLTIGVFCVKLPAKLEWFWGNYSF